MWHVGPIHLLLTNTVYTGTYEYGRRETSTGRLRADDKVIRVSCPPIVTQETFDLVQAHMRSRNPRVGAPRVVSGPILLTGTARCGKCGNVMTIRTGKSGRYRYYTCANAQARGKLACSGMSIQMPKLDDGVTNALVQHLFQPERLEAILSGLAAREADRQAHGKAEALRVEKEHAERQTALDRLYELVEKGFATLDDVLKERIARAQTELAIAREELRRVRARRAKPAAITPEMIVRFGELMTDRVTNGQVPFRKAYIRSVVQQVVVDENEITIHGHPAALREAMAAGTQGGGVPSSIQEWRARRDSNS